MKFKVLSRREIEKYEENLKHIVISIADNDAKTYAKLPSLDTRIGLLQLRFDDIDIEREGYKLFTAFQAYKILVFINQYKDKVGLIVCQCEAGISRSAGVAGALSKIFNKRDEWYFKYYIPNKHVYRTILEEANKRGLI